MVTKKLAPWSLAVAALVVLSLLGACSTSSATTTKPKTTTPAATTAKTTTPAATTAKTTTPAATTPAATPPKAPKAIHDAAFAASPAACTTCHAVGGAGVGAAGGTGLPASHNGRTNDICKGCHQLGS
jgi:nitrate reductase cytochrome c-type subunit